MVDENNINTEIRSDFFFPRVILVEAKTSKHFHSKHFYFPPFYYYYQKNNKHCGEQKVWRRKTLLTTTTYIVTIVPVVPLFRRGKEIFASSCQTELSQALMHVILSLIPKQG